MNNSNVGTRERILEAALKTFAREGFGKATIKQIAAEAGLSTTSLIYWYFKDKEELFQAVLERISPLVDMVSDPAELMERPPDFVLSVMARTFLNNFDNPDMVKMLRIFLSETARKPEIGVYFAKSAMIVVLNFLVEYLRKQADLGRLRPHDYQSSARSFIGTLVIYVLSREIFPPLKENLPEKERYIREMISIFLTGLNAQAL